MKRALRIIPTLALFASCTAISQQEAFLDALPRPNNIVFSEDFEGGLANWSQLAGTWTTGSPGANGVALISPSGTSGSPYTISTASNIDLTNRSNCRLQYDVRFSFSANSGASASGAMGQVTFAGNTIGEFKNTWGTSAASSAGQFLTRTYFLNSGTVGKLSIVVSVPTSTTADVRFDNITVTCNNAAPVAYSSVLENFESGSANWTFGTGWSPQAGAGVAASTAAKASNSAPNTVINASYLPNINLQSRSGCVLSYFYNLTGSAVLSDSINLYINGANVRKDFATVISMNVAQSLTAFEGRSVNSVYFGCEQPGGSNHTAVCAVDNLTLDCQQ